jgi:hypothetical protein
MMSANTGTVKIIADDKKSFRLSMVLKARNLRFGSHESLTGTYWYWDKPLTNR